MNTHADKTQENKSQAVSTMDSQMQSGGESTFQFVDNRPEAIAQRKLQEMANNSPQVSQLRAFQDMANKSPQAKQATQLQTMADSHSTDQQPIQKKENNTGLPDNLKTGMENLSGISLDDVKVHRNSDKPAQLQAHAYAQGTDIHLGPGQEKHLPHELGHVVQQKEGRVKATKQLKGKTNINDDVGLEREADVLGSKALQTSSGSTNTIFETTTKNPLQKKIIQRAYEPLAEDKDRRMWISSTSEDHSGEQWFSAHYTGTGMSFLLPDGSIVARTSDQVSTADNPGPILVHSAVVNSSPISDSNDAEEDSPSLTIGSATISEDEVSYNIGDLTITYNYKKDELIATGEYSNPDDGKDSVLLDAPLPGIPILPPLTLNLGAQFTGGAKLTGKGTARKSKKEGEVNLDVEAGVGGQLNAGLGVSAGLFSVEGGVTAGSNAVGKGTATATITENRINLSGKLDPIIFKAEIGVYLKATAFYFLSKTFSWPIAERELYRTKEREINGSFNFERPSISQIYNSIKGLLAENNHNLAIAEEFVKHQDHKSYFAQVDQNVIQVLQKDSTLSQVSKVYGKRNLLLKEAILANPDPLLDVLNRKSIENSGQVNM